MRYASLDYVRWLRLSFLFVLSVRQARAWGASQTNPKGTKRVAAFFQVLGFKRQWDTFFRGWRSQPFWDARSIDVGLFLRTGEPKFRTCVSHWCLKVCFRICFFERQLPPQRQHTLSADDRALGRCRRLSIPFECL